MTRTTGTCERGTIAGESVEAFSPHPLPPREQPPDFGGDPAPQLARANESILPLELADGLAPSVEWFVYACVGDLEPATHGAWGRWPAFFLEGVSTVADEAGDTSSRRPVVVGENRDRLLALDDAPVSGLQLFELLPEHPILTVKRVIEPVDCSRPAGGQAVRVLDAAGIARPLDERQRDRTAVFEDHVARLRQGTELGS